MATEEEYDRLLKQFPTELYKAIQEMKDVGMSREQIVYEIKRPMREYFDEETVNKIMEVVKI